MSTEVSAESSISLDCVRRVPAACKSESEYPGWQTSSHVPSGSASRIRKSFCWSSIPVTAMPTVPSVETIPSSFSARRNSAANIWKAITPAERNQSPGVPNTIPWASFVAAQTDFLSRECRKLSPPAAPVARHAETCGYACGCQDASARCRETGSCESVLPLPAGFLPQKSACELRPWQIASGWCGSAASHSVSEGRFAVSGTPSISTTWHPVLRLGCALARSIAASVAFALAMSVAEVTMPDRLPSMIARFTPEVRPKSSAFTMRRRTG